MPTNVLSIDQLKFKANSVGNGLDEVRLYNGTDALYCKEGVTTGLLMQDNQIKVVPVTGNSGVPAVGTVKGYIDSAGDYHIYDASVAANNTSLASLRDSVSSLNTFKNKGSIAGDTTGIGIQASSNDTYSRIFQYTSGGTDELVWGNTGLSHGHNGTNKGNMEPWTASTIGATVYRLRGSEFSVSMEGYRLGNKIGIYSGSISSQAVSGNYQPYMVAPDLKRAFGTGRITQGKEGTLTSQQNSTIGFTGGTQTNMASSDINFFLGGFFW